MPPSAVFSLLCRTVAEVTEKNATNGNNIPLLLLFRILLSQRNLAFLHMPVDTLALATYITTTYQPLKVQPATKALAQAFQVPAGHLDVAERVKGSKQILNQPADLNGELAKQMTNPEKKKWSWVVRNLKLRSVFIVGSPSADISRRQKLSEVELRAFAEMVLDLSRSEGALPVGCSPVLAPVMGPTVDQMRVDQVHWTWASVHVTDDTFEMVRRVLLTRFLHGAVEPGSEAAADNAPGPVARVGLPISGTPAGPPAGTARPPSGPAAKAPRGKKRATSAEEPVLPVAGSVRNLKHHRSKARWDKGVDMCASALIDDERRATVVKPPFVIGQVKPFSAWPYGGVVVFAQFPFLLDSAWRDAGKWTANCQKVMVFDVGGRYEVVFSLKQPPVGRHTDGAGGPEPLLPASSPDAPGMYDTMPLESDVDDAIAPADAAAAAGPSQVRTAEGTTSADGRGDRALTRTGARRASRRAASDAAPAGTANGREDEIRPVTAREQSAPGAAAGAAGTDSVLPAEPSAAAAPVGTATPGTPTVAVEKVAEGEDAAPLSLSSPQRPKKYVPLSEPLKRRFVRALHKGKASVPPLDDAVVEWAVLGRSAPSVFSMLCTFSSNLEIERSLTIPCGSHRSNNFITVAYPARDPLETQADDLD